MWNFFFAFQFVYNYVLYMHEFLLATPSYNRPIASTFVRLLQLISCFSSTSLMLIECKKNLQKTCLFVAPPMKFMEHEKQEIELYSVMA